MPVHSPPRFFRLRSFLLRTGIRSPGVRSAPVGTPAGPGAIAAPGSGGRSSLVSTAAALLERSRHSLLARTRVTATIEGTSLRIAAFEGSRLESWISLPLNGNLARPGQIGDPIEFGSFLDETFHRLKLPRDRVAWALPGWNAVSRVLDLSGVPDVELQRAIDEEVEEIFGASADDGYVFWQRLDGRGRVQRVFVLVVPRATVLTALEALEVAGIRPLTMDLRPLALARGIGRMNAIVANLEEGGLDVVIVTSGIPRVMRSIQLPSAIGVETAQARLVQEIERALAYYDDLYPEHPLSPDVAVYLTGRLATGIALAESVCRTTGRPIGRMTPAAGAPPDLPGAEYLVNVGLALKRW